MSSLTSHTAGAPGQCRLLGCKPSYQQRLVGSPRNGARVQTQAINIDRRRHLELSWQRQSEAEDLLSQGLPWYPADEVVTVRNLAHLEHLLGSASAGSSVVVVGFYARSCGACKEVFRQYRALCGAAARQRAGVRFLAHDVHNEFDDRSDISRLYGVRTVPSFLFFVDGAVVKELCMPDSRRMVGARGAMQAIIVRNVKLLQSTIQELLLKNTPSARR